MVTQPMSSTSTHLPMVSVVIPTMNAAAHLETAIESIRRQTYPPDKLEILVVDGGSADATLEIARRLSADDDRITIDGGAGVNCPAALNIGIEKARGELVWYLGGHGEADARFLELGTVHFRQDPEVGCVGGEIIPVGEGAVARANMIARFSVFGVGRGVYTTAPTKHDIETVQWGAYRRDALKQVGLFDPDLQFGEDEELNFRIRRAGFRILYDPSLKIRYFARPTFRALFRQYRNYGKARVRVLRKHPSFFRLKHVVPSAMVVGLAASLIAPIVVPGLWFLPILAVGGYLTFLVAASVILAVRERFPYPHYILISFLALHLGYGVGMLRGAFEALRGR